MGVGAVEVDAVCRSWVTNCLSCAADGAGFDGRPRARRGGGLAWPAVGSLTVGVTGIILSASTTVLFRVDLLFVGAVPGIVKDNYLPIEDSLV